MKNICFFILLFCSGCNNMFMINNPIPTSPTGNWSITPLYENQYDSIWPGHKNIKHLFDPHTGSDQDDGYIITKGYIVTNRNDTLNGYIKITPTIDIDQSHLAESVPFLPFNKTAAKDIRDIEIDSINLIRTITENNYTADYIPLQSVNFERTLWLLHIQKNDIKICYQYQFFQTIDYSNDINPVQNNYGGELVLVPKAGSIITIIPTGNFNSRLGDAKLSMLKFIRKRYHQTLAENSFKDKNAMVDYILDKENEKEISEVKKK